MEKKPFDVEKVSVIKVEKLSFRKEGLRCHTIEGSGTEPVGGRWCSWTTMENKSRSTGIADLTAAGARMITQAEMTAFWVAFREGCAPSTILTDNIDILSGLHRGDTKCFGPTAKETDVWIKLRRR